MTPPSDTASVWTREGMLLAPQAASAEWASHAQTPTVLVLSERCWRVYFSGRDTANHSRIFYADFDPASRFKLLHLEDRPLLDLGEPGQFDANGLGASTALWAGDQVWLYYSGFALRTDVPYQIAVGLAVSDDGGHTFRRACHGPVMSYGPHDPYFVSTPCVWRDGSRFHALYNSVRQWVRHDSQWECIYDLRSADSDDGIHWRPHAGPALDLAEGEVGLARPWVIPGSGGGYRMWFSHRGLHGFRGPGGQGYRMQAARSDDGFRWRREGADVAWSNPPAAGDWDGWMQAYSCVVPLGDELIMFYNGNDFGRGGFGWARALRMPAAGRPVKPASARSSG